MIAVAGCEGANNTGDGNGNGSGNGQNAGESLSEDRMVEQDLVDLTNTERYDPLRYQVSVYITERIRETIGLDIHEEPVAIGTQVERFNNNDFEFVTFNWSTGNGDPDSVLYNRFHSEGSLNGQQFTNDEYDELAVQQRREPDPDARQDIVHECQRILGELRPENQLMHNENIRAFNSDHIDPDSIVLDPINLGLASLWNWVSMEPQTEEARTLITNNWDATDQLNPFHANARGPARNNQPTRFLHDFLTRVNPESGRAEPWAAESIERPDNTTVIVTVRDDLQFHDGESLTLDDVLWTYNKIMETEPPVYQPMITPIDTIEETGDWEVTFNLSNPFAPFDAVTLSEIPILPQHFWEDLLAEAGVEDTPWEASITSETPLVGSGPFEWGEWQQGTRFRMPAFKEHPVAAPNIDVRVQRPLDTRTAEIQALIQGEYDLLDYWNGDPTELESTASEQDHLESVTYRNDGRMIQMMNCNDPPLNDPPLRQAVNAIVRQSQPVMIQEIYGGFGTAARSPIAPSLEFWHNPDTPVYGPGEEAAREILSDAGYAWDDSGNLYHPPEDA
jgi:peptide/nickel transport system substrate-binding protein